MKLVNKFLFVILLQTSFTLIGQDTKEITSFPVTELIVKPETITELKAIKWDELISVFDDNAANDSIKVGLALTNLNMIKRNESSSTLTSISIVIADISENKELVVKQIEKSSKAMLKTLEKWQNDQ